MNSVATNPRLKSTRQPTCSAGESLHSQDTAARLERLTLALAILDHRVATRDRHADPAELSAHLAEAERQARMALDGASIEQIAASA